MLDLAPLQTILNSPESPNESKLLNLPEEPPPPGKVLTWGTLGHLPNELLYLVLKNLTNVQDADSFMQATRICFPSALYRNLCRQSFGINLEISQTAHASRALRYSPSLASHTIIWENVKRILKHIDRPFQGLDSATAGPKLNLTSPATSAIHTTNILQMNDRPTSVDFHFSCFGSESYLTGVGVGGYLVGYEGDQVYTEKLQPFLRGLRLVYNDIGIITIQIQSGTGWSVRICGHGDASLNQKKENFFSESWELAGTDILAYFDVFYPIFDVYVADANVARQSVKLVGIAATTNEKHGVPSVWISRNAFCKLRTRPSTVIIPRIPHIWEALYLRIDVTAFSVFVFNIEQTIVGIEVQYSDETSSHIGLNDDSVVKLTLCLSLGGTCSSASDDDAVKSMRVGRSCNGGSLAMEVCLDTVDPQSNEEGAES